MESLSVTTVRPEEAAYWDEVAVNRIDGKLRDNIYKRVRLMAKLLEEPLIGARILEIGTGHGLTVAVVNLLTLANIRYTGTDVSKKFCDYVEKRWKLPMLHCDVRSIPVEDHSSDIIWAFDSLEHVRPNDREEGYNEINRILKVPGLIMLNVPLSDSKHDPQFDHSFDESDLATLCKATNTRIRRMEKYEAPEVNTQYQFVVLER